MRVFIIILIGLFFQVVYAQNPYPMPSQADLEFARQMMGEMNQQYQNTLNNPNFRKQFTNQNSKLGIDPNYLNKELENSAKQFSRTTRNFNTSIDMTQCMDITNPQFQQQMAVMEKKSKQFHKEMKALCASGNKAGAIAKQAEFAIWAQSQQHIKDTNKCFEKFKDKFEFPEVSELETSNYEDSTVPKDICDSFKL